MGGEQGRGREGGSERRETGTVEFKSVQSKRGEMKIKNTMQAEIKICLQWSNGCGTYRENVVFVVFIQLS